MDYPAQRDFVKELAVACRKAGLGLFIYYSVGIDWHHPYFLPNTMYDPARPHALGGVSVGCELRAPLSASSPRPWGCFQQRERGLSGAYGVT